MKICQNHWNDLRTAIEVRGLSHLVAKSGEKSAKQVVSQMQGDDSNANYDPLMSANFAIWNNALRIFGIGMMAEDAPCPLCHLDEHRKVCKKSGCQAPSGEDWIQRAADGQLYIAKERGLIPLPS